MTAKEARAIRDKANNSHNAVYDRITNRIKCLSEKGQSMLEYKGDIEDPVIDRLKKDGFEVEYVRLLSYYSIRWL